LSSSLPVTSSPPIVKETTNSSGKFSAVNVANLTNWEGGYRAADRCVVMTEVQQLLDREKHARLVRLYETTPRLNSTVGHKSHDPCFHVFLMEAGVITFVTHCTLSANGWSYACFRRAAYVRLSQVRLCSLLTLTARLSDGR